MALIQKAFSDIITFSRSSNATRVGPTGLVEYAPHNLLLQSQTFDNASWLKSNSSITANAIAAPDGTVTADKLVEAATTSVHSATQAVTFAANFIYTASVYAKAGERSFLIIQPTGDSRFAYYNLSNGTVGTVSGSPLSTQIQSVGNNWYRCTITVTSPGATAANCILYSAATDGNATYTGDGTSGIYLWGAQLSVGPYPLDYTPTTSAAVYGPRFDYDPVTLAARGLLIEEQRTNLQPYSDDFSNGVWVKDGGISVTSNAAVSPDGTQNADFIRGTTSGTNVWVYDDGVSTGVAANTSFTNSVYAKANGVNFLYIRFEDKANASNYVYFNLSTGTVSATVGSLSTTATITPVGNGWYRCTVTGNSASGSGGNNMLLIGLSDASGSTYLTASATNGIYIWGAQFEQGSFSTSYIPTIASTVTRSADVASVNTLSPWWNNVEGTLFADYTASESSYVVIPYTDANNYMILNAGTTGSAFDVVNAGSVQASIGTRSLSAKIAARFKSNDFAVCLNGGAVATDTAGTVPSITDRLALGYFPGVSVRINGHLRRVAFYPRALTSAELQAITA